MWSWSQSVLTHLVLAQWSGTRGGGPYGPRDKVAHLALRRRQQPALGRNVRGPRLEVLKNF